MRKPLATILFYPTGIVHLRNLALLMKHFREYRFKVIIEPWLTEQSPDALEGIKPKDRVFTEAGGLPASVWEERPDMIFLSMAYPNLFRLWLVREAEKRNIPVTAIEEVNQLALNDGVINHYFLPLDYLGAPSEVERERFLALGMTRTHIEVTGWPFFDPETALRHHHDVFWKENYNLSGREKFCLLILGSLKERDIVSLETRRVRQEILHIVTAGLPDEYQLIIKPHPVETEDGIAEIKSLAPNAIIVGATTPIEPLLLRCHVVVNRGNSQVSLLAMLQDKPIVAVPVGLKTIFHGLMDEILVCSPESFRKIMLRYRQISQFNYREMLHLHFPYSHEKAFLKVKELFHTALTRPLPPNPQKKIFISVLYAFLGDTGQAAEILTSFQENRTRELLISLYRRRITPAKFRELMTLVSGSVERWHLQALFIRRLRQCKNKKCIMESLPLLEDFDGDVNPHYFIDEILSRIELEYKGGRPAAAQYLLEKFRDDFSIYEYYRQGFDMMESVYSSGNAFTLRKILWLIKNFRNKFTRRYLKERFFKE